MVRNKYLEMGITLGTAMSTVVLIQYGQWGWGALLGLLTAGNIAVDIHSSHAGSWKK